MYFVIIFFSVQLLIAVVLWIGKQKVKQVNFLAEFENTSIIIPFKNESKRILPLIQSLNQSAITHKNTDLYNHLDIIFVDDHSTDETYKILLEQLDVRFRYFKLNSTSGKKYAIKYGVEQANYERILTLDADVYFNDTYLSCICQTPCSGLTVLPVNMKGKTMFQKLSAIEFDFLQHLTFGLAGFKTYFLCNGANLLFTKSAFNKSLKIRTDADILSGDDVFFLKAVKQLSLPVLVFYSNSLMVTTLSPESFKELLTQRKRWFTKMNDVGSYLGALFVLLSNLLFIYCLVTCIYNPTYLIPIAIKIGSEMLSVDDFKSRVLILLHQFYYPVYIVMLIFYLPKKNQWR
jgi:cellulose synthase/poly-beta-1,6-N-acetylglucosamine synthase-like glycosyltransferase